MQLSECAVSCRQLLTKHQNLRLESRNNIVQKVGETQTTCYTIAIGLLDYNFIYMQADQSVFVSCFMYEVLANGYGNKSGKLIFWKMHLLYTI